jgi:CheY-like chemotaxis protein
MPDHILIVDDEEPMIDLMRVMLRTLNHKASGATTGVQAINMIQRDRPKLILLDLMLPDMTGIEVCQRLKAATETADIPIVIFTARHDQTARDMAQQAGAIDLLTKPVSRNQLSDALDRVLL